MSKYRKEITVDSSSCVTVNVFDDKGANVGTKWYIYSLLAEMFPFIFSQNKAVEKRIRKAHKWADERMRILGKELEAADES